ncbi:MAG: DciA family protein [Pseudomonadota bacterium]
MTLERPALPSGLLAHIRRRQMLESALRASLPEELATHVFLLNVRGGTLVLGCDVQALVTPLRFHAPQLLAAARTILSADAPVRVAWRTITPPKVALPQTRLRRHAPETADSLDQAARCIEDAPLSSALHHLAEAMRRK